MKDKTTYNYKFFLLLILSSVGFYNPYGIFSEQIQKLVFYIAFFFSLAVAAIQGFSIRTTKYPRIEYAILLIGIFQSCIWATAFHMQSLKVSIMAVLPILLAFSTFYIFMKWDIPREKILNTYILLTVISSIVYFCNVATFPNNIFGLPIIGEDTSRGIIRIPVVFIEIIPLLVFYGINKWLMDKDKKWLFLIGFAFLMIVLSVIRQIILLTTILGLFFFFRNISWKFKLLMAAVAIAIVVYVLPLIPIYNAMIELSQDQKEENEDEENIRIQAWRYYTYENQTNALTPILGNGYPSFGNSRWGVEFDSETEENGCFAADVGWAGFFYYFGAISTLSLLIILIKATVKKKGQDQQYLNYWLIFLMLTSVASGPILYYWQIIDICVCLYLVYKKDNLELAYPETKELNGRILSSNYVPRYPQINENNTSL